MVGAPSPFRRLSFEEMDQEEGRADADTYMPRTRRSRTRQYGQGKWAMDGCT